MISDSEPIQVNIPVRQKIEKTDIEEAKKKPSS